MTGLLAFLLDPRFGVPILLLAVALGSWLLYRPWQLPRSSGAEPTAAEPDRDPVSRTYLPLLRGEYSTVLQETYDRLDRAVQQRTGLSLVELPFWRRAVARLGVPDPKGLASARERLDTLELWAVRLESDSWLRRDFWRSWESSRRIFLRRIDPALAAVDRQLTLLEKNA